MLNPPPTDFDPTFQRADDFLLIADSRHSTEGGRNSGALTLFTGKAIATTAACTAAKMVSSGVSSGRQKGQRMKEGTAEEADQNLEELEDAQRKGRQGQGPGFIDSKEKSKQLSDYRRRRIKTWKDVQEDYDE